MSFKKNLQFAQHYIECADCDGNAEYFCEYCLKNLCQSCRDIHAESSPTRSHTIVLYKERRSVITENKKEHCTRRNLTKSFDFQPGGLDKILQHISFHSLNKVWVSDGENIISLDRHGNKIEKIHQTFSDWGCHTVTKNGNLLYVDAYDNSIKEYSPSNGSTTVIDSLFSTSDSSPECIYSCFRNGNVVVAFIEMKKETEETGVISCFDKKKEEIWKVYSPKTFVRYISENINGDICMSRSGNINGSVIVVDTDGDQRFVYSGRNDSPGFMPLGICTDSQGLILVINATEHNIHVIDSNGTFLPIIATEERGSFYTFGLCLDTKGYLWTCGERGIARWEYGDKVKGVSV